MQQQITPLHCATRRGNEGVAEVLVAMGADVNAKSEVSSLEMTTFNPESETSIYLYTQMVNYRRCERVSLLSFACCRSDTVCIDYPFRHDLYSSCAFY